MFTGTFAYCLIVLRTVRGEGDSYSMFVPHLAVTGAMILALASVGVLIYYVHHVATSMQLSEIAARIAAELDEAIDKLYPERIGEEADQPPERRPAIPEHAMQVTARDSGYIQRIDGEEILGATSDHDVMIWLLVRPGDFVVARDPIAAVFPVPREASACADQVVNACALGSDRTVQQDVAFGVQQLVEVALRALSPGTNEPFTAITAIDRLGQALSKVACRKIPSATRMDGGGRARVVTRPRTLEKLLQEAFEPIVLYAGRNPAIAVRMLQRLERLARLVRRDQDRVAVDRMADTVCKIGSRQIEDERHRNLLAELRNAVHVALSSSTENRDRAKAS